MLRGGLQRRVMLGTHAPFLIYESGLMKTYEADLTDDELPAVLSDNAQRLL